MSVPQRTATACGAIAALLLAGCATTSTASGDAGTTGPGGTITVAAAASLGEAFETIAERFERDHPGVDVRPIVIDGSSTLATQIRAGAPYDVFVSADEATMARVAELVGVPAPIATSTLVIVVPAGNPGGVDSLDDLASVSTVLCAPEVPCGSASARLLEIAGVDVTPVSLEQSVRGVLAKVEADAVDAGLVYETDAAASDAVESIVPVGADLVANRAVIAAVEGSAQPELARAFVAYAQGDGRAVLDELGFGAP